MSFAAEEKMPELIADVWVMTPKAGHEADFHKALKEHVAFRASKDDPRKWQVYRAVTGDKLNEYIIRACCFEWAAQDKYVEWSNSSGVQKNWNENASQYVESYKHEFIKMDSKNSHWPQGTDASYVGVTHFSVKDGHSQKMKKAIMDLSTFAKENKWPHSWSWSSPISGSYDISLAIPHANFASMAPLDESFYDFVMKNHESKEEAGKIFDDYSSSIEDATYHIYRHDKDLSMKFDDD